MKTFLKLSPIILLAFLFSFNKVNAQTADPDSVFDKVEVEASFPGGPAAWSQYISRKIQNNLMKLNTKDYGTCIVKFIVDKNGKISNVEAVTMKKSELAKILMRAIRNGPHWIPAQQNGKTVNAYRLQPVTITQPDK